MFEGERIIELEADVEARKLELVRINKALVEVISENVNMSFKLEKAEDKIETQKALLKGWKTLMKERLNNELPFL